MKFPMENAVRRPSFALVMAALACGAAIAWVDSRPSWDDTGITAVLVFVSCAAFSFIRPAAPWLWALGVGAWIPLYGILVRHNAGSLLALLIAFVGAYSGALIRKNSALEKIIPLFEHTRYLKKKFRTSHWENSRRRITRLERLGNATRA